MKRLSPWLFVLFLLPFIVYVVYSYSQVDPNLVISKNPLYWSFQQNMWQLGYHMQVLSTQIYAIIMIGMFAGYFVLVSLVKRGKMANISVLFAAMIGLLVVSYNALSYDLFNYMFNARMVVKYHLDPHVHAAIEVSGDLWTRFMTNNYTTAPYGHGWTALSLIPYMLGLNTFNLTYYAFKLFSVLGFVLLFVVEAKLAQQLKHKEFNWSRWLFFLNPLVLVEVVGNVHNDIWMMLPYVTAVLLLLKMHQAKVQKKIILCIASASLYAASIYVKLVTIALLPAYGLVCITPVLPKKLSNFITRYWADLSAILMLIPLITSRSRQFHPWYLVWSLAFLPFARSVKLRLLLIGLSFASMMRYLPYLSTLHYTAESYVLERQISWIGGLIAFVVLLVATRLIKPPSVLE